MQALDAGAAGGREAVEHKDVRDKLATFTNTTLLSMAYGGFSEPPYYHTPSPECFPVNHKQEGQIMPRRQLHPAWYEHDQD